MNNLISDYKMGDYKMGIFIDFLKERENAYEKFDNLGFLCGLEKDEKSIALAYLFHDTLSTIKDWDINNNDVEAIICPICRRVFYSESLEEKIELGYLKNLDAHKIVKYVNDKMLDDRFIISNLFQHLVGYNYIRGICPNLFDLDRWNIDIEANHSAKLAEYIIKNIAKFQKDDKIITKNNIKRNVEYNIDNSVEIFENMGVLYNFPKIINKPLSDLLYKSTQYCDCNYENIRETCKLMPYIISDLFISLILACQKIEPYKINYISFEKVFHYFVDKKKEFVKIIYNDGETMNQSILQTLYKVFFPYIKNHVDLNEIKTTKELFNNIKSVDWYLIFNDYIIDDISKNIDKFLE